jgi:hypothetical protein
MTSRTRLAFAIAFAGLAVAPASALADLIAAYDHPVPSHGLDIGLVDLSTGTALGLPSGVNTAADESHPELSGDGSQLIFERAGTGIVDVPLHGSASFVSPISPPAGDPPFVTPGISPSGKALVIGQGSLFSNGDETMPSMRLARANVLALFSFGLLPTPQSTDLDLCDSGGSEPMPVGTPGFPEFQGFPGRGTADTSIDSGLQNDFMAWSTSVPAAGSFGNVPTWNLDWMGYSAVSGTTITGLPNGTNDLCVMYDTTLRGSSSAAFLQGTARFGAVTFERVPISSKGVYGPGDLGVLTEPVPTQQPGTRGTTIPPQRATLYPSGSASDATKINTPLDEHSPSWSQDGRYLAFVRSFPVIQNGVPTGSAKEVIEVYDNQSQMLVNPNGYPIDTVTASNDHAVRTHMAIALDPTIFHTVCTGIGSLSGTVRCTFTSAGPAGVLIMRVIGHRKAFIVAHKLLRRRTVPKLKLFGIVTLGREPRHFDVRVASLRVHGRRLPRGRYLIFIRARTKNLQLVRDLSRGIPVTVRR